MHKTPCKYFTSLLSLSSNADYWKADKTPDWQTDKTLAELAQLLLDFLKADKERLRLAAKCVAKSAVWEEKPQGECPECFADKAERLARSTGGYGAKSGPVEQSDKAEELDRTIVLTSRGTQGGQRKREGVSCRAGSDPVELGTSGKMTLIDEILSQF
jgi:hypothetical protein